MSLKRDRSLKRVRGPWSIPVTAFCPESATPAVVACLHIIIRVPEHLGVTTATLGEGGGAGGRGRFLAPSFSAQARAARASDHPSQIFAMPLLFFVCLEVRYVSGIHRLPR